MSQHHILISTASESPEDDESDYAVQSAQDRFKRRIFQRKLICFCVCMLAFLIVAGIVVGVLLGATDLSTTDNGKPTAGNVIPTPNTTTPSNGATTSTTSNVMIIPTPDTTTPSNGATTSTACAITTTPSTTPSPLPSNTANSKVLDYIDTSYDPCEDFYNYSCGNWRSTRPNASEWGTFDELALDNYNKLAGYLSQCPNNGDTDAIKKAKYIYSACTDTDYIQDNLVDQIKDFMDSAGGWHHGGFTPSYSWSINSNLYKDHYLGSSAFFSFGIFPDDLNSSKQVIRVVLQNI